MTTQFATASYQEIIDLHTETDRVSVLGIHTPVTSTPYNMLSGFFDMFQKYHYDGCSLTLVPAARLPADISQVSYDAGEIPIDPRDLLNPILWHGAHGESLGAVLNQFYAGQNGTTDITRSRSDSIEMSNASTSQVGNPAIYESLYYRALTDNTWAKAHPQRGFRKSGLRPLVYSVSTDHSIVPNSFGIASPMLPRFNNSIGDPDNNTGLSSGQVASGALGQSPGTTASALVSEPVQGLQLTNSSTGNVATAPYGTDTQFFTSRLHGLGWLDTRTRLLPSQYASTGFTGDVTNDSALMSSHYANVEDRQKINYLPRLFMGICLLPPAYKTEQYFRLVLNHRFSFKKFRGISMRGDFSGGISAGQAPEYFNFNNN